MRKTAPYKNLHHCITLFILMVFVSETIFGQLDPYKWNRLPSNSEINSAINDLTNQLNKAISVNGKVVDNRTSRISQPIKFHNKRKAGQVPPQDISRMIVFVEVTGIMGSSISEYNLFQNKQTGKFGFAKHSNATPDKSLDEKYSEFIAYLNLYPNNDSGLALGFAPSLSSKTISSNNTKVEEDVNNNSDDEFPWEVVIGGAALGAAIVAIRKRLKKSKNSKKKSENEEENEEKAGYILQLNNANFQLKLNEPQILEAKVWKVTTKEKKLINANFQIQNTEKALKISPKSSSTTLSSQLILQEKPQKNVFNIKVIAVADGSSYEKIVKISTGEGKQIIVEIEPGNKRSLRPNIERVLTCYTKVVDENGKTMPDLTKEIEFKPKSDWIDFSDPIMDEDWKVINIGASDPNAIAAVSHPPESIILSWVMTKVENDEEVLQKDIEIQLLDCKIDTSVDTHDLSFVASKEKTELIFSVFIEDCDGSEPWNFSAAYKTIDDKPDNPVSSISIEKISDIKAQITLAGPILLPKEGEQWIRKLLVISGQQDTEKPLERHLYVYVSKVGLYIEEGLNKERELSFIAKGDFEKDIEFGLYKYDPEKEEVVVDTVGLENLSFELLNKKKEDKNLASVLEVDFELYGLVTNIPRGRYTLHAPVEIPGYGDVTDLVYRVKAPIVAGTENPERFQTDITLKVETLNTGKRYPTWQEAYDDCKYIIDKYVPAGPPQDKLRALLEQRKVLLDAEGLTELRKKMWSVAYNLILAQGAEGYKDVDAWASAIVETLEWTQWAGDIAFNVLIAVYMKKFGALGGLGATGGSMLKEMMVEAIIFYIYEKGSPKDFANAQYKKIIPLLMNVTKGRLVSVDNIALCVKNNRPLAWAIFIAIEFAYNLYQTKSMIEAAKNTLRQIRDEYIIGKLTNHIIQNPVETGLKVKDQPSAPKKVKYKSAKVKKTLSELESKIRKNRTSMSEADALEIMKDPAMVRTIKEHGSNKLKQAFDYPRKKIYEAHDVNLRRQIAKQEGISSRDLRVDDFRTPGTKGYNLNTDRDYRLLRRHKMSNGKEVWLEVPRKKWLKQSYKELGKLTKKPANITDQQWADQLQQRGTDKYDAEACPDYSDHAFDSKTGKRIRVKPNILEVEAGKGTLIDPDDMGRMYKQKVINAGDTPEAFAQAKKGTHTIKSVRKGYEKQGYKLKKLDQKLERAMRIIENQKVTVDGTPSDMAHTKKLLSDLGYKNGVNEVMNQVSNEFKALKNVTKRSYTERFTNFLLN